MDLNKLLVLLAPYLPMDGMNEKGLSMAILGLETSETHQEDENKINTLCSVMIRGILDNCNDVDQAIEYMKNRNMHDFQSGYHYIISDRNKSVVIEYVGQTQNRELRILNPESYTNSTNIYVTNFYLSDDGEAQAEGVDRYETIENKIKEKKGKLEWGEVLDLLINVEQNTTLWTNVYNPEELNVISAQKRIYDDLTKFDIRNPLNYSKVEKK